MNEEKENIDASGQVQGSIGISTSSTNVITNVLTGTSEQRIEENIQRGDNERPMDNFSYGATLSNVRNDGQSTHITLDTTQENRQAMLNLQNVSNSPQIMPTTEQTSSNADSSRVWLSYLYRRGGGSIEIGNPRSPSSPLAASARIRNYTKSIGSLVKHLAASNTTTTLETTVLEPASGSTHSLPHDVLDGTKPFGEQESVLETLHKQSGLHVDQESQKKNPIMKLWRKVPSIWSPVADSNVGVSPWVLSESIINSMDYRIKYEFALILHNRPITPRQLARNGLDKWGKMQMNIIERCINAGLEVSVLSSTLHSRKYLVLLLRPTRSRLHIEKSRLVLERWLQIGAIGEVPSEIEQLIASSNIGAGGQPNNAQPPHLQEKEELDHLDDTFDEDDKFTPAERLQTIARIISSTSNVEELNPPGAGITLDDDERKKMKKGDDDIIYACFPLHTRRVNAVLLENAVANWWSKSDTITNDMRYYYGEQVAFYFAFVFLYTKYLLYPAVIGVIGYLAFRWVGAVEYMRVLAVFGFLVATLWGSICLKAWRRKNSLLNDAWNLRLFKEADYPNAQFKPQGYRDVVDSHGQLLFREPYYNSWSRIPAYIQTFVVFLIFILCYVIGITFFVQWYTAAMMAPLCSDCPQCEAFLSCFDTERPLLFTYRWAYILGQGVLLGVSLDVFVYLLSVKLIHFFVGRENHATDAQFQRVMINRLFVINWISFFLWFILIAFVIVPFGEEVESWLAKNFSAYKKLTVDWENGVIDMSTALVTPLLITQALNLIIDTALPSALRNQTLKASKMARRIMRANPQETLLALSEYQTSFSTVTASDVSEQSSSTIRISPPNTKMAPTETTENPLKISPNYLRSRSSSQFEPLDFKRKIELHMMTPIRIPYIEKELGASITTMEGFENEKYFMTADDVLEESQLPLFNVFPDYLRMVIQFGYVVMFSVVWPFCPLAAFANNSVHIRNCFNKLFLLRRRQVPRKANSIGQWEKVLFITLLLAVFVVVGLICVSSGELEYFLEQCVRLERFNGVDFSMHPDFSCLDLSSRFIAALVLEHAALLIIYVLMDNIANTPTSVRTSFQRKQELIRRAICGNVGEPAIQKLSSRNSSMNDLRRRDGAHTTLSSNPIDHV